MIKRNGHPEKSSRFICLRCLKENKVCDGLPRPNTKEKNHIKDIHCLCTRLQYKTENLEVRWCDNFHEQMTTAKNIQHEHYDKNGNYVGKRENILMQYRSESEVD